MAPTFRLVCAVVVTIAVLLAQETDAFSVNRLSVHFGTSTSRRMPAMSITESKLSPAAVGMASSHSVCSATSLKLSNQQDDARSDDNKKSLFFLFDPNTKGGALFLGLVLFVVPLILYNLTLSLGILDVIEANRIFGVGFTVLLSLAWVSTYIFRVATKDMTYAKQLRDYENAVMQKRLEELDEDEVQALMEEVDRDQF